MQVLSNAFKDRPMTPKELIIYWTEYVVRHNGAPYSRALGTDMRLYEYLMLDIIGAGCIIISVLALVIYTAIGRTLAFIMRKSKAENIVKNKYE